MSIKVTNTGKAGRGLPKGQAIVELARGESVEFTAEQWASLSKRKSISADVASGLLVVEGAEDAKGDEPKGKKSGKSTEQKAAE